MGVLGRVGAVVALVAGVVGGGAAPVAAADYLYLNTSACEVNWYGARACVMLGNNTQHSVRWEGTVGNQIPNIGTNTLWAMNNAYNPTDLNMYRDDSDPYPDVIITDNTYGDMGVIAWVECLPYAPNGEYSPGVYNTGVGGSHPKRWCRGQKLRFNDYTASTDYATAWDQQRVACHELGHTIGLQHYGAKSSCTYFSPGQATTNKIHSNEAGEINRWY